MLLAEAVAELLFFSLAGEQTRTHVVAIVLPVVLVLSVVVFACLVLGTVLRF